MSEHTIVLGQDGNAWMAHLPDFVNLQESPAGFGETPGEAIKDLFDNHIELGEIEVDATRQSRKENMMDGAARELPRYKCHKEVHALKIKGMRWDGATGKHFIIPADEGYAEFEVPLEWRQRHKPEAGGYFVRYEDGYTSYSPAEAFEKGYAPMNPPEPVETKQYSGVRAAKQIDNSFTYHPPKGDQANRYNSLRMSARDLAELFAMYCPESRELSLALTKLKEASMWANVAIARNE